MDFVHDQLATGKKIRVLTVVDMFSRFSPVIDPRFSYRAEDAVGSLERVCASVGYPKTIRVDQGSEWKDGANRPWTEQECRTVLRRAPSQLKLPIALAMFAGLRKSDFLQVTMAAVRDDVITVRTSKRGVAVAIPLHPLLKAAIAERPPSDASQLAVTSRGHPWTESGFNASFAKFKKTLEAEGAISPGLTPHGLRHNPRDKVARGGRRRSNDRRRPGSALNQHG